MGTTSRGVIMTVRSRIALSRFATLGLLCLPGVEAARRWYLGQLGPLSANQATLVTGDWAVILLLLSLALTPARGVFELPLLNHIRRYVGVASALYALAHLAMYSLDQKGNLTVVALEIFQRLYLTIGFAALLILVLLAIVSTDGWHRRLKRSWKRLNMLVYPAAALALAHFFMQSKIDVREAIVAVGLFAWLILWCLFSPTLRVTYAGLLLLAGSATLSALALRLRGMVSLNTLIRFGFLPPTSIPILRRAQSIRYSQLAQGSLLPWRSVASHRPSVINGWRAVGDRRSCPADDKAQWPSPAGSGGGTRSSPIGP